MEQTNTPEAPKRPTFLTVLCILSFIAAGISIIGGIIGYLGMAAMETMGANLAEGMEQIEGMEEMPGMADAMAVMKHAKLLLIIGSILTLVGLFGVIQMWKLKKTGFYIYTGAQVLGIVLPLIIVGGAGFSVMSVIFAIAFIVMYGMNLKHMS
ncbi:MAG: hypothetical protein LW750_03430 [Bacteroidetes bacterium]|jgi:hypothetical protein|nr:hypothetical protein [Bacteroidota bacterium]